MFVAAMHQRLARSMKHRYYLESRGVPPEVAERLVVLRFFDEVLDRLPDGDIVDEVRERVAEVVDWSDVMTTVCKFDDLVDGAAAHVIDGVAVAVVRIGDNVHAIDDVAAMPMCRCQKGRLARCVHA